ncbi:MAG: hypothetical protein L6V93_19385 [Clostridiales bacterium]|nr:MAG: hypothetical protein L6V93_19385 [Clostridiales bacterium]
MTTTSDLIHFLNSFFSPRGASSIFSTLESAFDRPRMFKIDGDKIYRNEFESEAGQKCSPVSARKRQKANGENKEKKTKKIGRRKKIEKPARGS